MTRALSALRRWRLGLLQHLASPGVAVLLDLVLQGRCAPEPHVCRQGGVGRGRRPTTGALGLFVHVASVAAFDVLQKSLAKPEFMFYINSNATHSESNMATFKYFSDINGEAIELKAIHQMDNAKFAAQWPGVKGMRADGYTKWVAHTATGTDAVLPVTRMIEMKRFPTKHECNAKCLNGKHNGTCECQCGGQNHGRGMFTRMLEAA